MIHRKSRRSGRGAVAGMCQSKEQMYTVYLTATKNHISILFLWTRQSQKETQTLMRLLETKETFSARAAGERILIEVNELPRLETSCCI